MNAPGLNRLSFSLAALTASNATSLAADKTEAHVSYYRQVRPILQANCQGCHQPA